MGGGGRGRGGGGEGVVTGGAVVGSLAIPEDSELSGGEEPNTEGCPPPPSLSTNRRSR